LQPSALKKQKEAYQESKKDTSQSKDTGELGDN
jgi:hypothetical protein